MKPLKEYSQGIIMLFGLFLGTVFLALAFFPMRIYFWLRGIIA